MLRDFSKKMTIFLKDERGQSTTEYILILAVVVMIAMKFRETIGKKIQGATEQIGTKIDTAISDDGF